MDLYKIALDEFNRHDLIQQEAIPAYFARARMLLFEAINTLVRECSSVQEEFASIAIEQTAKLDHHRTLFKRSITVPSGNIKKYTQRKFLEHTMDLLDSMTASDNDAQVAVINDSHLTRYEFETILSYICEPAKTYVQAHNAALERQQKGQNITSELEVMAKIEEYFELPSDSAYGVLVIILNRVQNVQHLYAALFRAYARLLIGTANAISGSDHKLDTIQDGAQGLTYAISSYDHNAKNSFSTYAKVWIKQQALYYMKVSLNTIRPSMSIWQQFLVYDKAKRLHETKYGVLESSEVPEASELTHQQVANIQKHLQTVQVTSLDSPLQTESDYAEGSSLTVQSSLGDQDQQEENEREKGNRETVYALLEACDPVTRKIVCLRFGLIEYLGKSASSRRAILEERVRQVASSAIQRKLAFSHNN